MVQKYTYLEIFLDEPIKWVNLSEFEKYYDLPHQTIKRHIQNLINDKIIIEKKMNKFLFYYLNFENPLIYNYFSICEKERLFKFLKKKIFKRLYELLFVEFEIGNFMIFGSSTKEEKYNDIDILVLTKNKKCSDLEKIITKFEKTYAIKVHLLITDEKNLTNSFKKELLKKHIILNNHDFFVNFLYGELYAK